VTTEDMEPTEPSPKPASPLARALARVPEDVRAAVEAGQRDDRWDLAEDVIHAAVRRDPPGAVHTDYARILLAMGSFQLCREALDKTETSGAARDDAYNIEAELLVEQAAAQQWTPVPERDGQAIPTTTAAIVAMEDALRQARALGPADAETLRRLDLFEEVVTWARRTPFSGNLGAPLAASLFVLLCVIQWARDRTLLGLEGSDILPLAGLYLAATALYIWLARTPQVALNRQVIAGAQNLDQRFLQSLLKAGPLVAVPVAAVRSLVYGSIIPLFVVYHCVRRRQPMISGLVLGACLATAHWYTMGSDHEQAEDDTVTAAPEKLPGLQVVGLWLPLGQPISQKVGTLPTLETDGPGRWRARTDSASGGHSIVIEADDQDYLVHVSLTVWGESAEDPSPQMLVRQSSTATQDHWGPPVSTQERSSGSDACKTVVQLYGETKQGLRVRRQDCAGPSKRVIWEAWPR